MVDKSILLITLGPSISGTSIFTAAETSAGAAGVSFTASTGFSTTGAALTGSAAFASALTSSFAPAGEAEWNFLSSFLKLISSSSLFLRASE